MYKHMMKELCDLSVEGVYAFINEKDKKIYVGQSKNVLNAVMRHIERFKLNAHECHELQKEFNEGLLSFKLLEKHSGFIDRLVLAEYYKHEYSVLGYIIYKQKKHIRLNVRVRIETKGEHKYKATVSIISNRKHHLLGVFDTIHDANEFVAKYYTIPYKYLTYAL